MMMMMMIPHTHSHSLTHSYTTNAPPALHDPAREENTESCRVECPRNATATAPILRAQCAVLCCAALLCVLTMLALAKRCHLISYGATTGHHHPTTAAVWIQEQRIWMCTADSRVHGHHPTIRQTGDRLLRSSPEPFQTAGRVSLKSLTPSYMHLLL